MADKDANILVRVGGDVKPLKKALKSGKGFLKDFGKEVRESINTFAKWGATVSVAAAGVSVAVVKSASESARELQNLSTLAGVSTNRFQKLAFGAKKLGIENDKLGDIFKDTRDKVGDFLQTGAGPLVDFFDNIAPKVGVTADQFRELSGPDALQLYVSSLEKANVSQNEMTFFMEAIASDATLLLPLMKDNGKAMGEAAKRADELNIALSDIEVEQLAQATTQFGEIETTVKAVTNRIAIQLAPVIGAIADRFLEASEEAGGMEQAIDSAFQVAVRGAGFVGNAIRSIQVVIKGLEISYLGLKSLILVVSTTIAEQIDGLTAGFINDINFIIESVNKIPGVDMGTMIFNESAFTTKLRDLKETSINEIRIAQQEMQDLLMQQVPSTAIENYLNGIKAAAKEAAEVSVKARDTALGIGSIPGKDDPLVQIEKENRKRLAIQNKYNRDNLNLEETRVMDIRVLQENSATVQKEIQKHTNLAITGLMRSGNETMFNIGKVAAVAIATRDGISSAIGSYKIGAGIGGPVLGAAFATASLLATGAMINDLTSTSFGGGGGTSPSAPSPSVASPEAIQTSTGSPSSGTLTVEAIDPNALFSGSAVSGLAERLLEYQRDGGVVVLE